MSKAWIRSKYKDFARDVMRDFCLAATALEEQFRRFDESEEIGFEAIKDLTGEEMNKGLLWRLKDTAHHVFRNDPEDSLIGRFLDWGLGYIFHETIKLKEDAYQQQSYAPWFRALQNQDLPDMEKDFAVELMQVLSQTRESIQREIRRIRFILRQCRGMLPIYYGRHRSNALLARFLFDKNDLVRKVFKDEYEAFIQGIYGEEPELLYILAAQSLKQGGWMKDAERAEEEALRINPNCRKAAMEV